MTKRKHAHRPKGSYPHPDGGYLTDRTHTSSDGRRIKIAARHKAEPDTEALARVFIRLAEVSADATPDADRETMDG